MLGLHKQVSFLTYSFRLMEGCWNVFNKSTKDNAIKLVIISEKIKISIII